jgi:hypothetical protein
MVTNSSISATTRPKMTIVSGMTVSIRLFPNSHGANCGRADLCLGLAGCHACDAYGYARADCDKTNAYRLVVSTTSSPASLGSDAARNSEAHHHQASYHEAQSDLSHCLALFH